MTSENVWFHYYKSYYGHMESLMLLNIGELTVSHCVSGHRSL